MVYVWNYIPEKKKKKNLKSASSIGHITPNTYYNNNTEYLSTTLKFVITQY
jgi:hypothetical protein